MESPTPHGTEPDDVYNRLHEAIVRGNLMPNERLIELDLARAYGVGRAAIRTALARLVQEGLVEHEPNRGARVRLVSETEAIEILEARAVLEGLVAHHAASRATDADIAQLRMLEHRMQERLAAGDLLGISELNGQLHALLQQIAAHQTASRLLERMHPHHVRYRYRTILVPGRAQQSLHEHHQIIDALASHDSAAAEQAMRTHLAHVVNALRQTVKTLQPPIHE